MWVVSSFRKSFEVAGFVRFLLLFLPAIRIFGIGDRIPSVRGLPSPGSARSTWFMGPDKKEKTASRSQPAAAQNSEGDMYAEESIQALSYRFVIGK